ncbi:MAG: DoxX family membrane protein [Flavobacteriales bacterium]|nr:DoxX family membrane protein [Flavobacteriales bacterium]MBK6944267.1 DoxX family membrane protein [Flavobacteriales bacterium]MBK7240468.1 DoxX family membrane protein [Flavobacteriales bacterium]MBK7295237.1 DoxX family membrane protein [Flavobacteriales bacterium]MBK9533934.1 DoxX family membrane protein [Flavobacteriales bacterium]
MEPNVQLVKNILKYTFGLVPIVAGLDKFTNILTNWSQYISEGLAGMLPFEPSTFMMIVGVIEIVAGILVLTKTKIGAYVVSAWLAAIALTLIASWSYVDIAVRDLVMAIGAFSLAKLSEIDPSRPNS